MRTRLGNLITLAQMVALALSGLTSGAIARSPRPAHACTSAPTPWPAEATARNFVAGADYIFSGHVIATASLTDFTRMTYSATVQISQTFKGVITDSVVIIDGFGNSALCFEGIAAGPEPKVFFANRGNGRDLYIRYERSGAGQRAGAFPLNQETLLALLPPRVWLPVVMHG